MVGKYREYRLALLLVFMTILPTVGVAQHVKIVGVGASSCSKFLQDIAKAPLVERDYLAWAQGYMSGLLLRAPPGKDEDLDLLPSGFPLERQAEFLRDFCEQRQQDDFSDGVNDLYRALRGKQA